MSEKQIYKKSNKKARSKHGTWSSYCCCDNFLPSGRFIFTYWNVGGVESWIVGTTILLSKQRFQHAPWGQAAGAAEAVTGILLGGASKVRHVQQTAPPELDLYLMQAMFRLSSCYKIDFHASESRPLVSWSMYLVSLRILLLMVIYRGRKLLNGK